MRHFTCEQTSAGRYVTSAVERHGAVDGPVTAVAWRVVPAAGVVAGRQMELVRRLLDDDVDPQTEVRRNDLHRQEPSRNAQTQRLVNLYQQT